MEFFEKAKTVRLKGPHGKYLWAEDDRYKISQNREGRNEQALWRVEKVPDSKLVRLVSCYDSYLTAHDDPFLLGMTGKKVIQTQVRYIDSSIEWEPISEGFLVKLKTCHGNFLRANNGLPPWRGSVTHDLPTKIPKHQEHLLWEVENVSAPNIIPVEVSQAEKPLASTPKRESHHAEIPLATTPKRESHHAEVPSATTPKRESHHAWILHSPNSSQKISHPKPDEGRTIFFCVADDNGEAKNIADEGWLSLKFKGHSLQLLQERLQAETGIEDDIILCARHPMSTKLYTLRVGLPPNNATMHVVVVKTTSSLARTLSHVSTT